MRSRFVLLLALLLPAPLAAQAAPVSFPHAAVTLFTGVRAPFSTGFITLTTADGEQMLQVWEERQGGALLGGDLELGVGGPFRLLVGGSYSQAGTGIFFDRNAEPGDPGERLRVIYGGSSWFAKAGLSYRLQAQPSLTDHRRRAATDFFLAPALVRELDATHPAVNFGFKGAFPVRTSNVEVMVGVEDYLVFWRHEQLRDPVGDIFDVQPETVRFLYDTSNRLLFRLGATLRM
jgi:hypothetical protein